MATSRKVNFGRLVKSVKEPDSVFSLADQINKHCADGGTSKSGSFSVLGIKRSLKGMLLSLQDEEFDRDKFFKEFFNLYNLALAPDLRAKNVIHPSSLLDECPRKLVYDLSGVTPTNLSIRGISGELQRVFDVGSWYHLYFQNILFSLGYLEAAEVPVIDKDRFINGKADGVFLSEVYGKKALLEIKTMNSWTFQRAVFKPFKKHEFQASLYADVLGIESIVYLYVNKDTSEIRVFVEDTNKDMVKQANDKITLVKSSKDKGVLPTRVCDSKKCDRALACPFRDLCFK